MDDACNECIDSYIREMDDSSRDGGIYLKGLSRKISWCMSHGMEKYDPWDVEESDLTVVWRNQENIVKAAILG